VDCLAFDVLIRAVMTSSRPDENASPSRDPAWDETSNQNLFRYPEGEPSFDQDDRESSNPRPRFSAESLRSRLPRLSLDGPDRVYPIRSVLSVEPTVSAGQKPPLQQSQTVAGDGVREYTIVDAATWSQLQPQQGTNVQAEAPMDPPRQVEAVTNRLEVSDPGSVSAAKAASLLAVESVSTQVSSDGNSFTSSTDGGVPVGAPDPPRSSSVPDNDSVNLTTARFQHIITDDGHALITSRDDKDIQSCEEEPIHTPGAIQNFGVLVALQEESEGRLVVRIASENSAMILGYSPQQLFALDNFCDILTEEQEENLLDHVDFIRDEACDPRAYGPEVFILSVADPARETKKCWCAMHINDTNKDLIICEFELEDDQLHPLNVSGQTTPSEPSNTMGIDPTSEELAASTVNISRPLRVLRNARRRRGEAAAMKVFSILSQIQEQLSAAPTLDILLNITVGLLKELTGFHRVMIYQFDNDWNGIVVAELVDPRATKDLYKGLHFPASDIPKQARELYKINRVRLIYDRDLPPARLVCRTVKDLESPLDMTHAYLRAVSPYHLKYLTNMDVRASMSISINALNELWGLISCHSYGTSGMRVSFPIRKMCRLIGDAVSRNIERLSYTSRLQARKLINTVPTEANPSGYIIASSDDLLKLFGADYGALSIREETKILGRPTHSQEVLVLLEYLKMRQLNSVLASHDVSKDFTDLRYPPGFKDVAGLLYVPLSAGGCDFMVFFRRGQVTEIKWAGNPYQKELKGGSGYLEPRKSFQTWCETVLTRSRQWSESDVETAAVLCLVYGKFIEVWRQKEAAMQSTQLTKLLLANSAHEVRTPLNAIINYLEIALESALDSETRENLARSHSASKSLIYVINDLLDLTNTEKGQNLIKDEVFDLPATFKEAADMFDAEAKRKRISYNVTMYPGVPKSVLGDQRRVRQVMVNIISNAIENTTAGAVTVEIWRDPIQAEQPGNVDVEIAVHDTGSGMSQATVDALFQDLEQVSSEDDNYYYEQDNAGKSAAVMEGDQKRVLGLGLALVARIVRNMHGQLSVKSEEGKGSHFKILLRFSVPEDETSSASTVSSGGPASPPTTEGEILLVGRNAHPWDASRPHSSGSNRSLDSSRSGRSEADRIISAIQEPAPVNRVTNEGPDIRRLKSESPDIAGSKTVKPSPVRSYKTSSTGYSNDSGSSHVTLSSPQVRSATPLGSPLIPGQELVTDSGVPLSAIRLDRADIKKPKPSGLPDSGRPNSAAVASEGSRMTIPSPTGPPVYALHILVAEDDPVNSKIMQKRLERFGHSVHLTMNGEECATAYRADSTSFDAVLMDLQVSWLTSLC
jgi:light-regulated signal transduction histidine kinase (bacteriophytochrome)